MFDVSERLYLRLNRILSALYLFSRHLIFARNVFSTCINSALIKKMNKSISIEKRSSDSPVSSYYILSQKTTQ